MNRLRRQFNKLNKIIQGENRRNRVALDGLRELGFSMPEIRKALIDLNGINIRRLGNGEVSVPTLYNTVKGKRVNEAAMSILADSLRLQKDELFPSDKRT